MTRPAGRKRTIERRIATVEIDHQPQQRDPLHKNQSNEKDEGPECSVNCQIGQQVFRGLKGLGDPPDKRVTVVSVPDYANPWRILSKPCGQGD